MKKHGNKVHCINAELDEITEEMEEENQRLRELKGKKKHEAAMLKAKKKAYPWARF